ncbi:hypothetical protein ACNKU7_18715 [Microbulbifer sp. SA54]|uniref:hypothetical protein n=1 Tax=Microbulbifer sp. SA54 TaxID=3401577 RepID=UPI003AAE9F47
MEDFKIVVVPLIVAIISAVLAALFAINLKYAKTKEEALSGIKASFFSCVYYAWVAWLIFIIFREVTSVESITRGSVFLIVINTVCIAMLIQMHFLKRIISVVQSIIEIQNAQIDKERGAQGPKSGPQAPAP